MAVWALWSGEDRSVGDIPGIQHLCHWFVWLQWPEDCHYPDTRLCLIWMFYHDANETVETGQWRPPLISAAPGIWTWAPVPASVGQTNTVKYPVIIFTYSIQRWWLGRLRLIYAIQEIYRRGRHNQTVEFIFRSEAAGWLVLSSVILGLGKRWNGRGDQTCPRTLINEI